MQLREYWHIPHAIHDTISIHFEFKLKDNNGRKYIEALIIIEARSAIKICVMNLRG